MPKKDIVGYVRIREELYGEDMEFFKDHVCEFPPCEERGVGFARGVVLCRDHYDQAVEIINKEGDKIGK